MKVQVHVLTDMLGVCEVSGGLSEFIINNLVVNGKSIEYQTDQFYKLEGTGGQVVLGTLFLAMKGLLITWQNQYIEDVAKREHHLNNVVCLYFMFHMLTNVLNLSKLESTGNKEADSLLNLHKLSLIESIKQFESTALVSLDKLAFPGDY